jgi:predicted signal transduction protein with EAL and GGDEF domain
MQRVTLVRYVVKQERLAENEKLARAVFADLRAEAPRHVAYALFRRDAEFVHLFVNTRLDDSDALTALPGFRAYARDVDARCESPVQVTRLGLEFLESFGFPDA